MSEPKPTAADAVHPIVRTTAEWAWRLLVIFAFALVLAMVVQRLATVVIPLAIALLAAALLAPLVDWLQRRGVPRALGVFVVLVGSLGLVAGTLTFVVEQFVVGVPQLSDEVTASIHKTQDWLINGPMHLSDEQIRTAGDTIVKTIESNQDALTSGALTTATMIGHILTGTFLTLFILIFFIYSGDQIWHFVTRIVPAAHRERVRIAGELGFGSLVGFVRATVAVAAVDAIGIGAGLAILGVPLALPLASLVFISAFIPIIGAFLAGFVAVFIALVTKGFVTALIVLGIIIAVMQLEGHVLQPLLLGRAVSIHPLAVVLAITTGVVVGGIAGGLLAVPFVAVMNTAIRSLLAANPEELFGQLRDDAERGLYTAEPDEPEPGRFDIAAKVSELGEQQRPVIEAGTNPDENTSPKN
ncbi:AI-2E family transporter [Nocardia donostiensis]|uniref:AI-2E family transporter n=1 Tax=Nocardia donostiensis TaxID=1538463 RepID=A0A1W0AQJ6_9NOCA|nr:AI-2E family transporter [Nocardia donostiensis]ONM46588.1 AI-2E family transporter [Nocardia donostiensis]OQS12523.1 AI-2E family transporter [Nocardia donostiensis]OQS19028.1 AI-2E family transporter [Nocardia donostiensis]